MNTGYNPYRTTDQIDYAINNLDTQQNFFTKRLAKLSTLGRNYSEVAIRNAKGIHANEDISTSATGIGGSLGAFSRKAYALLQEKTSIAALSQGYMMKLPILREYATKNEIQDLVSKLTNEIVVYNKQDKKYCEIEDLPNTYSKIVKNRVKDIFNKIYTFSGFNDGQTAWGICRDWLVEGYVCREIIWDKKGKNITGFQKLDPLTILPLIDPQTGIKLWVQNINSTDENRKIFYDADIIYFSYSGASNYMETSYVEPLVRPYNEWKMIERTKVMFNLNNATLHREFEIATNGFSINQAKQKLYEAISDNEDNTSFDDTTGLVYFNGSKNIPYSKDFFWSNDGVAVSKM